MKVLLLSDRMNVGGAETHLAQLARGLQKMGVDVTLISEGGATADRLEALGIPQIRLPFSRRTPWHCFWLRRKLKHLIKTEKYDILHAHARFPAFLMRGLGKDRACEIVTVHAKFRLSTLLRRLCNWGTYTIAVSEDLRRYVIDHYNVLPEQVTVIPNGIDCRRFFPSPLKANDSPRILFASRMDDDCALGAELLCRAAPELLSEFPDLSIGIAGGGSAYKRILSLAEKTNQSIGRACIHLYGNVEDMSFLLQQQDIFVGVSRAAMEAAACECAVILCGNEGYFGILSKENAERAMYSNFCARACDKPTAEVLKRDLQVLLKDQKTRTRYALEAKEVILQDLNAEQMCRRTLALYRRAKPIPREKRILLGGYVGCGNIGDDAILHGVLSGLRECAPKVRVTALSGRGKKDSRRFHTPCIHRKNPLSIFAAFLSADAFLCGGGSLLQNGTSNRSLAYYLTFLRLSRLLFAKPILYAAGIGPLRGKWAKKRIRSVLNRCSYISLRDPESLLLLERIGVERAILHLGADPTMLMPLPPASRTAALLQRANLPSNIACLAVILRGGREHADTRRLLLAAARMIANRHGMEILYLILDCKRDLNATRAAIRTTPGKIIPIEEPGDAVALLRGVKLTLSMRLHGLIFSTLAATPAIGIPTDTQDDKILSFANLSAQDAIARDALTVALLVERGESMLQNAVHLKPLFLQVGADLRKKAKKDLANIVTMIYNNNQNVTKSEDI